MSKTMQSSILCVILALILGTAYVSCIITVNIGGANRLTSLNRQRDRYNCFWDCDLVGCQISSDDDECAYDCEKICRPRYDWARSSSQGTEIPEKHRSNGPMNIDDKSTISMLSKLSGKSAAVAEPVGEPSAVNKAATEEEGKQFVEGESVRLHLPRNATARKFAIWERCSAEEATGKLKQTPFSY